MSIWIMCSEFLKDSFFSAILQENVPNFLLVNSNLLILMCINADCIRPKCASRTVLLSSARCVLYICIFPEEHFICKVFFGLPMTHLSFITIESYIFNFRMLVKVSIIFYFLLNSKGKTIRRQPGNSKTTPWYIKKEKK